MHKNKKCKIVNLRSLSFVTTARGMALVTSKGLRQLKKKSKLTTFYTKKNNIINKNLRDQHPILFV